jgi:serine phosphatase RsbU (regulator of sigma subunit)
MTQGPENQDAELRRLHAEADARERDIDDMDARDIRNDTLIERLRREAVVQAEDFATLNERLAAAEHELEDLRAVRDALTPPRLPHRPGLELAATFIPASADQVSGDFYLVAEGPQESTCSSSATWWATACGPGGARPSCGRRSPRPLRSPTIRPAC